MLGQGFSKCSQSKDKEYLSPFQKKTQASRTAFSSSDTTKKFQFCIQSKSLSETKSTTAPSNYHLKGKTSSTVHLSDRKAFMSAQRRGAGTQMDKGISTVALTQVSSLTKGLPRLFCGALDLPISQSEAQMNNFPPRHDTAGEPAWSEEPSCSQLLLANTMGQDCFA